MFSLDTGSQKVQKEVRVFYKFSRHCNGSGSWYSVRFDTTKLTLPHEWHAIPLQGGYQLSDFVCVGVVFSEAPGLPDISLTHVTVAFKVQDTGSQKVLSLLGESSKGSQSFL